jgi:hypothetical protein
MEGEKLLKYIGWRCTLLAVNTIEHEFYPYKILICDANEYNKENYLYKKIRCLLSDGFITNLKIN